MRHRPPRDGSCAKDKDSSIAERMLRQKAKYEKEGLRRSVEGILLVNEHNHPHVLLLQAGQSFKLPGGRLRHGEDEVDGLIRKLNNKLSPTQASVKTEFEVGDCVAY